ncbi:MAG: putative ABC transporter permease [Clostridia bacterium]|nr:putative ABC transporter permease [Clostridia bacterium]
MEKTRNARGRYGINRYFLLWTAFSFLGWVFEVIVLYLEGSGFVNRGFLSFPICPIYGTCIVGTYLLIGTPDYPRGIFKLLRIRSIRYVLYFLAMFILPTLLEFVVGWIFDKGLGVSLWDYSRLPYNIGGYVSLPVSFGWGIGLFLCMELLCMPLKNLIGKIPNALCWVLAVSLGIAIGIEFTKTVTQALANKDFTKSLR